MALFSNKAYSIKVVWEWFHQVTQILNHEMNVVLGILLFGLFPPDQFLQKISCKTLIVQIWLYKKLLHNF